MVFMHKIARPWEYLLITGFNVKDIKVAKKAWTFPGQICTVFEATDENYNIQIQAMSAEKLPVLLMANFRIGPKCHDKQSPQQYAKLISPHEMLPQHVRSTVTGVIGEQITAVAASLTLEEISKGIWEFKQKVIRKVQRDISQFGLIVYHANLEDITNRHTRQKAAKTDAGRRVPSTYREGEGKQENTVVTEVRTFENRTEMDVAWAVADWGSSDCGTSSNCGVSASTDTYCW